MRKAQSISRWELLKLLAFPGPPQTPMFQKDASPVTCVQEKGQIATAPACDDGCAAGKRNNLRVL